MLSKLWIVLFIAVPVIAEAQISGTVINSYSKQPLSDVNVVGGNDTVAVSNQSGFFHIKQSNFIDTLYFVAENYLLGKFPVQGGKSQVIIGLVPNAIDLPEVEVSGNLVKGSLDRIPGSISVVTHENLQGSESANLVDYTSFIPGVYAHQGTNSTTRIVIRGIGSRTPYGTNRLKAYYNEIPLTTGEGITSIEDISTSDIEKMEVLKGPSSAIYGASLGGVIRLYSIYPEKDQHLIRLRTSLGSFSIYNSDLNLTLKKESYYIQANSGYVSSKGYRENNEYRRMNLGTTGAYFHPLFSINWIIHFIDLYGEIPSSLNAEDFSRNPSMAATNWMEAGGYEDYRKLISGLTVNTPLKNKWGNSLTLFAGYFDQYELRPFNILDDQSVNFGFREYVHYNGLQMKFVLGTEYFTEKYKVRIFSDEQQRILQAKDLQHRQNINLFTMLNLRPSEKLNFILAGNINSTLYRVTDQLNNDTLSHSGDYSYRPVVSPRFGLNYKLASFINLYTDLGHGFSTPSVEETLMPEGLINTSIKPETGWSVVAGSRLNFYDNRFFADVSVYWIWLENLLVTKRETEDVFYGINAGSTYHNGLETLVRYNFFDTRMREIRKLEVIAAVTLSDNKFRDFMDDENDYSGNNLPGIPNWWMNISMEWKSKPGITIFTECRYAGEQYLNDSNTGVAKEWGILNINVKYDFRLADKFEVEVFFNVSNVLNKKYASMILVNAPSFGGEAPRYYYPGTPRHFKLGLFVSIL